MLLIIDDEFVGAYWESMYGGMETTNGLGNWDMVQAIEVVFRADENVMSSTDKGAF